MTRRYQHLTAQVQRDVARRVGGLFVQAADSVPEDRIGGAAGAPPQAN